MAPTVNPASSYCEVHHALVIVDDSMDFIDAALGLLERDGIAVLGGGVERCRGACVRRSGVGRRGSVRRCPSPPPWDFHEIKSPDFGFSSLDPRSSSVKTRNIISFRRGCSDDTAHRAYAITQR